MRQRSFSLADVAAKARERSHHGYFGNQSASPSDSILNEPTISEDFSSIEEPVETKPPAAEQDMNDGTETPKPRKAIPVNKPNAAQPQGPTLRPKTVPKLGLQPTEPATEKPTSSQPSAIDSPMPSGKPVEPKAAPFVERYERITTYLEKPLFRRVHGLHQRGEIAKIASLLNAAVREYLERHYQRQ